MEKPDDYGIHEIMDRASLFMEMVEMGLLGHDALRANEKWKGKALEAYDALYDLYQMIGAEHLK